MRAEQVAGTVLGITVLGLVLRNAGAFNSLMATGGGLVSETIALLGGGDPAAAAKLGPGKGAAPGAVPQSPGITWPGGGGAFGVPFLNYGSSGYGAGVGNPSGGNAILASLLNTVPFLYAGSQTAYSPNSNTSYQDWLNMTGGAAGGYDTSGATWV